MNHIIDASSSEDFITYATADLVIDRCIIDITYCAGSYGMGGYGFFCLKLNKTAQRNSEWLVCTIFSASDWLTVNGRWLSCHPAQYSQQKPLKGVIYAQDNQGNYLLPEEIWDDFQPLIIGKILTKFNCQKNYCQLTIDNNLIAITANSSDRPYFNVSGQRNIRQI